MSDHAGEEIEVRVVPAGRERIPVMDRLYQLYLHDFSEYVDLELNQQGRFEDPYLESYWKDPQREPYFIEVNDTLAGFVLIKRGVGGEGSPRMYDVAEFFVTRGYRRQGIGTRSAFQIWDRYRGRWRVRVIQRNQGAVDFWEEVIREYTGGEFKRVETTIGAYDWYVYRFSTL